MIRGQNVKSQLIAKSLASIRKDHYRPNFVVSFHPTLLMNVFFNLRHFVCAEEFVSWVFLKYYFRKNVFLLFLAITPKVKTSMALWCITRTGSSRPTNAWAASSRWVVLLWGVRACLLHVSSRMFLNVIDQRSCFWNVALLQANNKGVGVIGIIECHFLEPTHNKQSFDETDKYR